MYFMKQGLFAVRVLLFSGLTEVFSKMKCTTDSDCNPTDEVVCSVCAEQGPHKELYCAYLFPYMFKDDASCTAIRTCRDNCSGRGECFNYPGFVPFCRCDPPFYGYYCQNTDQSPLEPKAMVPLAFDGVLQQNVGGQFFWVDFTCGRVNDCYNHLVISVETNEGGYKYTDSSKHEAVCNVDKTCSIDNRFELSYPFKQYTQQSEDFLIKGDQVIGYLTTFSVRVHIYGKEVYSREFNALVRYAQSDLRCITVITMLNCSKRGSSPTLIDRDTVLEISYSARSVDDLSRVSTSITRSDCSSTYSWSLINLKNEAVLSMSHTPEPFVIEPYSLDNGLYKILLVIKSPATRNFGSCYFKVKNLPLVALIDGGSDRKVLKKYGLSLSASRSRDPNMPPSQQDHVYLEWSCVREDTQDQDEACEARRVKVMEVYRIPAEQLSYGGVYRFTLNVGVEPADRYENCEECNVQKSYVRIQVAAKNDPSRNSILIECASNCGALVNPNQQLFLKASLENNFDIRDDYVWSYFKSGKQQKNVDSIKFSGLPSYMFLAKAGSFEVGASYTVKVDRKAGLQHATYSFTTEDMVYQGDCEVHPSSGIREIDLFLVNCTIQDNATFIYEFYDKTIDQANKDAIFNGRMLGTSRVGRLENVRLTREVVCVYIINRSGLYRNITLHVKLADFKVNKGIMDVIYNNLTKTTKEGDSSAALRFISSIIDVIPPKMITDTELNKLLEVTASIPLTTLDSLKMSTSTFFNILVKTDKLTQLTLNPSGMTHILNKLQNITKMVSKYIHEMEQLQYLSSKEVGLITTTLLNCLTHTLLCKDNSTKNITDDYEPSILYTFRDGAYAIEDLIDNLKDVMTYLQAPGEPPTKLTSSDGSFVIWVMKHDRGFKLQSLLQMERSIPVKVPDKLQNILEFKTRVGDDLVLQVMTAKDNLFWWSKSDVDTHLVSVTLGRQVRKSKLIDIKHVDPPLETLFEIPMNLNNTRIYGSVRQPDPNSSPISLDMSVNVHRLDAEPGSSTSISILNPSLNNTLRVFLTTYLRPDYDMMVSSSKVIPANGNTVYQYKLRFDAEPTFFYLGILPGPEVPVNKTVSYIFELNTTLCQFWAGYSWSAEGCELANVSADNMIYCQCYHLSIFAAAFPVPPQEINPFDDIELFVTVYNNPVVVVFVSTVILFYILASLLVWRKDKADIHKRSVVILEDNFPIDKYPYLVAVFTSSRFNAGTTANVGLQIFGSFSASRAHILECKYRKVLQTNSDDWFLIYTSKPLGDIYSLRVWHDNHGHNPDWFCDKIFVYDLRANVETLFVVEEWLAMRLKDYPEALLVPAASLDVLNMKRMFLDNCVLGLKEGHILFSILLRHPRSELSRVQRISIFMAGTMVAVLCTIMFYKPRSDEYDGLDEFRYTLGSREFLISLQSLVVSSAVGSLILFLFKKTLKRKYMRHRPTLQLREDDTVAYMNEDGSIASRSFFLSEPNFPLYHRRISLYHHFVKSATKIMKSPPFYPVQLSDSESIIKVRKKWLAAAWLTCLVVIFSCSYLVILYGLKMGSANSKMWLSTVFMTVSEDVFITAPIKIILFAVILSISFQRMYVVDTHSIVFKDVRSLIRRFDEKNIMKIVNLRNHPKYRPLSKAVRKELLRKQILRQKWWTFIDFVSSVSVVVIAAIMMFLLWDSHYYNNCHLITTITSSRFPYLQTVNFFNVTIIPQTNLYLRNSLITTLFNMKWYNSWKIENNTTGMAKYWATDYTNKMVGLPMIRQLRVSAETCETIVNPRDKCLPKWTDASHDTDDYGTGWSLGTWAKVKKKDSPWKYTSRDSVAAIEFVLHRLYGGTGTLYRRSGYLATLGPQREDAEMTLTKLRMNDWQDPRTRALFVELTVYNPNQRMFSQVTLIAEYLVYGNVRLKARVDSIEGYTNLRYWSAVFLVFIAWYLFRVGYIINQIGLLGYFSEFNNVCRFIVVTGGIITIVLYIIHFDYSVDYFKEFQNSGQYKYFDFDSFSYYFVLTRQLLFIFISVAFIRMIHLMRFGRTFLTHLYIFLLSIPSILWLTLVFIVLISSLHLITLLLNISYVLRCGNQDVLINKQPMNKISHEDLLKIKLLALMTIRIIILGTCCSLYLVLFIEYSKIAKGYHIKDADYFNYFSFLGERLGLGRRRLKGMERKK